MTVLFRRIQMKRKRKWKKNGNCKEEGKKGMSDRKEGEEKGKR